MEEIKARALSPYVVMWKYMKENCRFLNITFQILSISLAVYR